MDEVAKAAAAARVSMEKALEYVSTEREAAAEEKRISKFKEVGRVVYEFKPIDHYALESFLKGF